MTSKSLFLVNSKENHKRRIWVWIMSLLIQLALYPGILTIYFSRIHFWHMGGAYNSTVPSRVDLYKQALQDAAVDGLGFQPNVTMAGLVLGALIAVQGFSYLYDRKKVDLYYSVPVSGKRRFFVVYINGIFIYVLPNVIAILIGIAIVVTQGAFTSRALVECGLAFVMNLLYFLIVYHIAILAVMLTGNIIITGCALMTFLFIGYIVYVIHDAMRDMFFVTYSTFFGGQEHYFSIIMDYLVKANDFRQTEQLFEIVRSILPLYAKWVFSGGLILALAYFCYRKRPVEAAGKAIAFPVIKPFVKIAVSATVGIFLSCFVYNKTYYNMPVTVLALVIGTVFCCCIMEIIYEFDIRALVKHPVSTGICAALALILFCVYCFDLFGYDDYIPDAEKVESVAIELASHQNYWNWSEETQAITYINQSDYLRENMFLTDIDAVCELAKKSWDALIDHSGYETNWDMEDGRLISVLYRLKSGREVSRCFGIDFADPSNEELLNRLIGTKEYREGHYQIMKEEESLQFMCKVLKLSYSNGAITCELPASDAEALRTAWMQDMEQFNFTLVGSQRPCGMLKWGIESEYINWTLPVYESFTNTIEYLKEQNAYYPVVLRAEDIASMEITNYHYDEREKTEESTRSGMESAQDISVARNVEMDKVLFEDPEEIAEIVEAIYPMEWYLNWTDSRMLDRNYNVVITFKRDTDRPYGMGYFEYRFISGQVPDFVAERTAY